ncbi:hypothetical protein T492DRAFT_1122604 [Pavlovales sp. CCMP2436]|nr:hypothetical protein T492DRAFT_1122604 [Pavlovales sp. CCMP2436]
MGRLVACVRVHAGTLAAEAASKALGAICAELTLSPPPSPTPPNTHTHSPLLAPPSWGQRAFVPSHWRWVRGHYRLPERSRPRARSRRCFRLVLPNYVQLAAYFDYAFELRLWDKLFKQKLLASLLPSRSAELLAARSYVWGLLRLSVKCTETNNNNNKFSSEGDPSRESTLDVAVEAAALAALGNTTPPAACSGGLPC